MTSDFPPTPAGQPATPGAGARANPHGTPGAKPLRPGGASPAAPDFSSAAKARAGPAAEASHDEHPSIEAEDWDILFSAIEVRLRQAVGEHLGQLPSTPAHSAQLSASLVQAVVLDCVDALHKLHAAIKHDRSQRPTP
jgi:hypothetical protein